MEEMTYQSYKGRLTENQQKLLEKVQKRHEKVRGTGGGQDLGFRV